MSNILIKQRADAQFRKPPATEDGKAADGAKTAMSDYEAGVDLVTSKIAHLKALRLARDAAEAAALPPAVAVKKAGRKQKQKAAAAVSLSDWLKGRDVG